jgi:hypothetical protein
MKHNACGEVQAHQRGRGGARSRPAAPASESRSTTPATTHPDGGGRMKRFRVAGTAHSLPDRQGRDPDGRPDAAAGRHRGDPATGRRGLAGPRGDGQLALELLLLRCTAANQVDGNVFQFREGCRALTSARPAGRPQSIGSWAIRHFPCWRDAPPASVVSREAKLHVALPASDSRVNGPDLIRPGLPLPAAPIPDEVQLVTCIPAGMRFG